MARLHREAACRRDWRTTRSDAASEWNDSMKWMICGDCLLKVSCGGTDQTAPRGLSTSRCSRSSSSSSTSSTSSSKRSENDRIWATSEAQHPSSLQLMSICPFGRRRAQKSKKKSPIRSNASSRIEKWDCGWLLTLTFLNPLLKWKFSGSSTH